MVPIGAICWVEYHVCNEGIHGSFFVPETSYGTLCLIALQVADSLIKVAFPSSSFLPLWVAVYQAAFRAGLCRRYDIQSPALSKVPEISDLHGLAWPFQMLWRVLLQGFQQTCFNQHIRL